MGRIANVSCVRRENGSEYSEVDKVEVPGGSQTDKGGFLDSGCGVRAVVDTCSEDAGQSGELQVGSMGASAAKRKLKGLSTNQRIFGPLSNISQDRLPTWEIPIPSCWTLVTYLTARCVSFMQVVINL